MKNLELTEEEIQLIVTAIIKHYNWETANPILMKIDQQIKENQTIEE